MKQLTKRKNKFSKNIHHVLGLANSTDFVEGEKWYRDARLYSFELSKKYGVSFRKVCAILAALSPRNRWQRNKEDAETLIQECLGLIPYGKYATYGAMVDKARRIFASKVDSIQTMLTILNGQKISAFFLNIYDSNSQCVTVDSWIQLISLGEYLAVDKRPSLTKTDYKLIEETIKELASTKKVAPPVMQAVLWISFKRMTEQKDFN